MNPSRRFFAQGRRAPSSARLESRIRPNAPDAPPSRRPSRGAAYSWMVLLSAVVSAFAWIAVSAFMNSTAASHAAAAHAPHAAAAGDGCCCCCEGGGTEDFTSGGMQTLGSEYECCCCEGGGTEDFTSGGMQTLGSEYECCCCCEGGGTEDFTSGGMQTLGSEYECCCCCCCEGGGTEDFTSGGARTLGSEYECCCCCCEGGGEFFASRSARTLGLQYGCYCCECNGEEPIDHWAIDDTYSPSQSTIPAEAFAPRLSSPPGQGGSTFSPRVSDLNLLAGGWVELSVIFSAVEYDSKVVLDGGNTVPGSESDHSEDVQAAFTLSSSTLPPSELGSLQDQSSESGASTIVYIAPTSISSPSGTVTIEVRLDDPHSGSSDVPGGSGGNRNDPAVLVHSWTVHIASSGPTTITIAQTHTNTNTPFVSWKTWGTMHSQMKITGTPPSGFANWNGFIINEATSFDPPVLTDPPGGSFSPNWFVGAAWSALLADTVSSFVAGEAEWSWFGYTMTQANDSFWDVHSESSENVSSYLQTSHNTVVNRNQTYWIGPHTTADPLSPTFTIGRKFHTDGVKTTVAITKN